MVSPKYKGLQLVSCWPLQIYFNFLHTEFRCPPPLQLVSYWLPQEVGLSRASVNVVLRSCSGVASQPQQRCPLHCRPYSRAQQLCMLQTAPSGTEPPREVSE